ncbi:ABC-F family ATP-binding cassette domain-containing protein [Rubrivivax albus]|uniref:Probable ATP-binding protein YheS n=1 Tax=Rubrivivax albus TaxID=2499835 RepID=A0A437K1P4_9BURK|nr:ATP-binding cassette domain-containing protein [Rubrivivax albus]RVT54259.1 ATP-binding cassette domain-containing protein [Rubrivivax albus]
MITLRNLTLRRGTKVVLQDANVVLNPGEKVGLVGRNGAGKSSLFALLASRLHADAGDAEIPPTWRIGEVAQHMPETTDAATDFVLQGDQPLVAAQEELAAAEAADDGEAIAHAHLALADAGAFDARARAQALLLGLGFRPAQLDAPVNSFSGGWRMRLQLARALMNPSDLLLLDEPTNHLDLDALVWLEAWLQRYAGTMVVISHDREFLDAITRVTLHLDNATLTRYGGNYSAFEEMRAERLSQAAQAFAKQQERIAHLQRFIDRFKAKATKAKQAQSRVKALARMERLAPVLTESEFDFEFREPANLPNPMLSLQQVSCGYGQMTIVRHVERTVLAGQRVGILGANGQGKSTLVKTIAHMLPALGGQIVEGKGLAIGYFAQQEMDLLSADDTPLQRMVRLAREVSPQAREQELRNFLGQFRFEGEMVHQRVGTLSGGERARLVLATIVWQRPNLLLLDEPTNHLDLATREALSIALNEFEGTVMLVSHDRALLREVCDEFWLVTAGGVLPFDGDLDDYQRWLLEVSRAIARGGEPPPPPRPGIAAEGAPPPSPVPAPAPAPKEEPRKAAGKAGREARAALQAQTRPLRVELQQIDARLEKLAAEKAEVEAALADPAASDFAELGRRLAHVGAEVAMLEERWLELQTQLEDMTS